MNKVKIIPKFKSEAEERRFWETHDTTDYLDTDKPLRLVLPNLAPSTKIITLRLPESLLYSLKILANQRDVPYQSLLKVLLSQKIKEEFRFA